MADYIAPIQRLIEEFRRLPGVGGKTAARFAFSVLDMNDDDASKLADAILGAKRDVKVCPVCCGYCDSDGVCDICSDEDRDSGTVCVVENAKSVMVLERVRGYKGKYHVLGGVLSPIDNVTARDLNIQQLIDRVSSSEVNEVIVATNPTPSGDATAAYLAKILEPYGVATSRLAFGLPVGGDIEYADEVTLYRALEGRKNLE